MISFTVQENLNYDFECFVISTFRGSSFILISVIIIFNFSDSIVFIIF